MVGLRILREVSVKIIFILLLSLFCCSTTLRAQEEASTPGGEPADRLIGFRESAQNLAEKRRWTLELEKLDLVLKGELVEVIPGTFHSRDMTWMFTVRSKAPELPWETSRILDGNSYPDPEVAMTALKEALESQSLDGVIIYNIKPREDGFYACVVKTVQLEDRRTSQVLATTSPQEAVAVFRPESRRAPVTTAALEIQSVPPGAEVKLNGEAKGFTPLRLEQIPPVRTEVELSWDSGGPHPWKTFLDPEVGKSYRIDYRSTSLEMAAIPGGTFQMGNLQGYEDEKPLVTRRVSSFRLSKTEISQALWTEVMGYNPSFASGDSLPVDSVTWLQTLEFCNRLSLREGLVPAYRFLENGPELREDADGYRLPTEAEWEYAARGGGGQSGEREEGWSGGNSDGRSHPSRSWQPNAFGLYDMAGNLWEWVWDDYAPYGEAAGTQTDAGGKVIRGGSWLSAPETLRSTHRDKFPGKSGRITLGFRVARSGTDTTSAGVQP